MLSILLRRLRRIRKVSSAYAPDPQLYEARREVAVAVGRFSVAATVSVAAVTVAGSALAVSQLANLDALYRTPYGVTLVIKLVMVGFVMLLGGYNHRFLVPRVIQDSTDERAWRRMRQTVQTESFVILFGVLVASVALASGGFAALLR
jgi:putative copper export protein